VCERLSSSWDSTSLSKPALALTALITAFGASAGPSGSQSARPISFRARRGGRTNHGGNSTSPALV
jgi:hypothetical protein